MKLHSLNRDKRVNVERERVRYMLQNFSGRYAVSLTYRSLLNRLEVRRCRYDCTYCEVPVPRFGNLPNIQ